MKTVSRREATRQGLRALGWHVAKRGSKTERWERAGERYPVFVGVGGSFRRGRSRTASSCQRGTRFEATVLQAALDCGYKVRASKSKVAKAAAPEVDWIARSGCEVPSGTSPELARVVCKRTVEHAAGRAMFCACGSILDARRTWVAPDSSYVECDRCHDRRNLPVRVLVLDPETGATVSARARVLRKSNRAGYVWVEIPSFGALFREREISVAYVSRT